MNRVVLAPGVVCTRLGFGCAPILGSVDAATADRAIGVALDEGIGHFDTAPSYGYGEGEAFLGRRLVRHRDRVTIATKFGIRARPLATLARPIKGLVRQMLKSRTSRRDPGGPAPRVRANRVSSLLHERVELTGPAMRASLERSLRALRTDYVDILLLHEPDRGVSGGTDLRETACRMLEEGKIRAFGVATPFDRLSQVSEFLTESDILQVDLPHRDAVDPFRDRPSIRFSVMRSDETASPKEALAVALSRYPKSVLLVSMFTVEHIRANAQVVRSWTGTGR